MVAWKGWKKAEHSADAMVTQWVARSDGKMAGNSADSLVARMEDKMVEHWAVERVALMVAS